MSTWSYTKGADRSNKSGKFAPSLKVGKKTPELDGTKRSKAVAKNKKKKAKRKAAVGKNQAQMKLTSKLYNKLKREPDFKHLPWKELWDMALAEVKRNAK